MGMSSYNITMKQNGLVLNIGYYLARTHAVRKQICDRGPLSPAMV